MGAFQPSEDGMTRGRRPIRSSPALRLGQRQDVEQNAVELLTDSGTFKESFIARETAALKAIRSQLPPGKTVREYLSEAQVAEIFREHGFASEEDYQLQHYLAFPPERRQ
jgi:hypothetical protein